MTKKWVVHTVLTVYLSLILNQYYQFQPAWSRVRIPAETLHSVFHLKFNPNNSICKLWWHHCNKTKDLSFSFWKKNLQNSFTATFSKTSIHRFSVRVSCDFAKYFWVVLGKNLFSIVPVLPNFVSWSNKHLLWEILKEWKSRGVGSGDSGGQRPHPTALTKELLQNSCCSVRSVGRRPIMLKPATPDAGHVSCVRKFCYQSACCCLIRYLVTIRTAKCFTNSSKRFRCEVMFENEHTFCLWINHVLISTAFAQLAWAAA
jgi:hypothetical protein